MSAARDFRMDNLKGLLIFLVVLGHLLELVAGAGSVWLYRVIYSFHMPAFVFCSGYFARFSWKKLGKIALPYCLFQVLYVLFLRVAFGAVHSHPVTTPYWLMWYLFSMMLWTLCVPLLERRGSWGILLLSAVIALAAGCWNGIGYPFSLSRTLVLLPFFVAGHQAGRRRKAGQLRPVPLWMAVCGAVLAAAGAAALWRFPSIVQSRWFYHSYSYALGGYTVWIRGLILLTGAAWVVWLLRWMPERRLPLLSRLGANTLPVFLLHGFVVKGISRTALFSGGAVQNLLLAVGVAAVLCLLFGMPWAARLCQPWAWISRQKQEPS